ncbi:single-stranded DNA-binding protein [candidate division KSB1 bacterium]|nr:single-stranded DNA-binding protein [candidate division KSB1 bacterium]
MTNTKIPDLNNVMIAGHLINQPELHNTEGGSPRVTFIVASNRKYKDKNGVWRDNNCAVHVSAENQLAQLCCDVLQAKSSVLIEGELANKFQNLEDNNTRHILEVIAKKIQFLDLKTQVDKEEVYIDSEDAPVGDLVRAKFGQEDQEIPPTDFDFGYQDLKI